MSRHKTYVRGLLGPVSLALVLVSATPPGAAGAPGAGGRDLTAWQRYRVMLASRHVETGRTSAGARGAPSRPAGVKPRNIVIAGQETLDGPKVAEADTVANSDVAMDLANPNHLVAVFQEGQFPDGAALDTGYGVSTDGGATWTSAPLPGLTEIVGGPYKRAANARVAYGPGGVAYAVSQVVNVTDCSSGVAVNVSVDGGTTWSDPAFLQQDTSCDVLNDMPSVAVDTFTSSPHFGRIYVAWDQINGTNQPILLSHSDNGGVTWSLPFQVNPAGVKGVGPALLVQPNGDLTAYYSQYDLSRETVQTSHNGGSAFDAPVVAGDFEGADPPDMRTGGGLGIGDAAVDPVTGYLYIVWQDMRFNEHGLNDIVLAGSRNGGATWGPIQRISRPTPFPTDHFTPGVSAYGGFVHIDYYHRYVVGGQGEPVMNRGYVYSADNGETWSKRLPIGYGHRELQINLNYAATVDGLIFLGDYETMTNDAANGHPVWTVSMEPKTPARFHQADFTATMHLT